MRRVPFKGQYYSGGEKGTYPEMDYRGGGGASRPESFRPCFQKKEQGNRYSPADCHVSLPGNDGIPSEGRR